MWDVVHTFCVFRFIWLATSGVLGRPVWVTSGLSRAAYRQRLSVLQQTLKTDSSWFYVCLFD